MDNVVRIAPIATGVFGGSGNHTIQIVVLVAVAVLLIGYFGFRFAGRDRGASSNAAAGSVAQVDGETDRPHEGSPSDGTVRLERRWTSFAGSGGNALVGGNKPMTIAIDGISVGEVEPRETVDVAVAPGHHTLQLSQGRHRSPARSFDVAAQEVVSFSCHGPRYGWPQLLAALVKPDLWISLKRD